MSFTIPVKFVSSFEHRHYLSEIGEGGSHCLALTNEFRKDNGHKDRFSPIFRRTSSFTEINPNLGGGG